MTAPTPGPLPQVRVPSADRGYLVLRQDRSPGYVRALRCQFCDVSVTVRDLYRAGDRSGQGAYNRARGKIVAHIYEQHREAFHAL